MARNDVLESSNDYIKHLVSEQKKKVNHHQESIIQDKKMESDGITNNKQKSIFQIITSWFIWLYELVITLIVRILRYDPKTNNLLPKHIAFIMDGNRRYANKKNIPIKEGHRSGYKKLKQCLNWCEMLGVKTVTVYAFSIDNFKRDKQEVDNIMDLMDRRFKDMVTKKKSFIIKYKVILRVLGDFKKFPQYVQDSAQQAMDYSYEINSKYGDDALILNLCCPYTSTFEIENAVTNYVSDKLSHDDNTGSEESTIESDTKKLDKYFLTTSEPDIIVRTSGEMRLSDFLTWQCEKSMIYISPLYWPEFSFWQLVSVIFQYQKYRLQKG